MLRHLRRLRSRAALAAIAVATLLLADSRLFHHTGEPVGTTIAPPGHERVLVDTSSVQRPFTALQHRSLLAFRTADPRFDRHLAHPRGVALVAFQPDVLLPPARMRYRRATHDADGEPPA